MMDAHDKMAPARRGIAGIRERLQSIEAAIARGEAPPPLLLPWLRRRAWHDPSTFEWAATLAAETAAIRSELEQLLRDGRGLRPYVEPAGALHDRGDWNVFYLRFWGERFDGNCAGCPITARLVDAIPRLSGSIIFSGLTAGTHIPAHNGGTNAQLTFHLPLIVPQGCSMRVGTETRTWHEGELVVFDDSYDHEVWHRGDRDRWLLIGQVWHPDLSSEEISFLETALQAVLQPYRALARQGARDA
jgi:aspartyl/asparaginyl beta-hydroxylase (cupin superfamily)